MIAQAFAETLEQIQTNGTLVLPTYDQLVSKLCADPAIEILECSDKKFSAEVIEMIMDNLTHHPALHTVNLSGNSAGLGKANTYKGLEAVARLLTHNNQHNLRILNLSNNNLSGAINLRAIGLSLQSASLVALDLSHNNLDNISDLSCGLKGNTHLEILNLGHNRLSFSGCTTLTAALEGNSVLRILLLNDNLFDNYEARYIANDLLKENTALEELNIASNNKIGKEGFDALIAALETNMTLQRLVIDEHLLNETQREILRTRLTRNTRLSLNWGEAALFIAFKRANVEHPLSDSIVPLIDTIQKMVWGDPTPRNRALSLISDIRKRVHESLILRDSVLSLIESIQKTESDDIHTLRKSIVLLVESTTKMAQDSLAFEEAVLSPINASQILMQNNIPLAFKNAASGLIQYIGEVKENDLTLKNPVLSLTELMNQNNGSTPEDPASSLINRNRDPIQISSIESIRRVTSSNISTLKETILPLADSIQEMAQGNMLVTVPTTLHRIKKFNGFPNTFFFQRLFGAIQPGSLTEEFYPSGQLVNINPGKYYAMRHPLFYSRDKIENGGYRIHIRDAASKKIWGEILRTKEIPDYWKRDNDTIQKQARNETGIHESLQEPHNKYELASCECNTCFVLSFFCLCCCIVDACRDIDVDEKRNALRKKRDTLYAKIQQLTDEFIQDANEQMTKAIAEMFKEVDDILDKRDESSQNPSSENFNQGDVKMNLEAQQLQLAMLTQQPPTAELCCIDTPLTMQFDSQKRKDQGALVTVAAASAAQLPPSLPSAVENQEDSEKRIFEL